MLKYNSYSSNLNRFLKAIHLKKQYLKEVQNQAYSLNKLKEINYKKVGSKLSNALGKPSNTIFVTYIIEIAFSKKNTLFHISDCSGNIKFFYSAGSFQQKGKGKIARSIILRKFYRFLISKLKSIRKVPIAIHLKNVDSNMFWFLKKLKKKFFIVLVKHFNQHPYNGCRKKKIRRKKFKSGFLNIRRNG